MNNVSQLPSTAERKERRRLHLRDVDQAPEETPANSVGATLRAARLERGEETAVIAAMLKMRPDHLEAIEENDFARLPGRTYAVGFIRSYARHLGLDPAALIQQFKDESAGQEVNKPVELVFPEAPEEQRLPNGSILILALVIAMVIYGLSYLTMPGRKAPATAKADEPVVVIDQPEMAAAPMQSAAPATPAPSPATTVAAVPAASNATPTSFVAGDTNLPGPALPAAMAPVETPQILVDAALVPTSAFMVAQAPGTQPSAQPGAAPGSRVTLTALQPTYIRIRDPRLPAANSVLIERVLNPGESFQAPDRAGLIMQTGNAGGLQVEVDGRNIGVLGKSGEVITRIPVDASYFLERMAVSQ